MSGNIGRMLGIEPDARGESGEPLYNLDRVSKILGWEKGLEDPEVLEIISNMNPDCVRKRKG